MSVSQEISDLDTAAEALKPHQGFVLESVQAEALLKRYCHLSLAEGHLGQRHYALAFPKGSTLTDKVSQQILRYVESGVLFNLKHKWDGPQNCSHLHPEQNGLNDNFSRALPFCKSSQIFSRTSSHFIRLCFGRFAPIFVWFCP